MGYDYYITRNTGERSDEPEPNISEQEWRDLVEADPELSLDLEAKSGDSLFTNWKDQPSCLHFTEGRISAKYPDEPLFAKMLQLAQTLGAKVQGDDGEIYQMDGSCYFEETVATSPSRPGIISRILAWFEQRSTTRKLQEKAPELRVGQRVKTSFGDFGSVLDVDADANGGLGNVRIRLDDGREQQLA